MRLHLGIWPLTILGSAMLCGGVTCFLLGLPGAPLAAFAWPGYFLALLGAIVLFWIWAMRKQVHAG